MREERILVVDDDLGSVSSSERHSSWRGSRSTRPTTRSRPNDSSSSDVPDAIVLDIGLPGIDGLFYCARLRENPRTSDVPIIVISGSEDAGAWRSRSARRPSSASRSTRSSC